MIRTGPFTKPPTEARMPNSHGDLFLSPRFVARSQHNAAHGLTRPQEHRPHKGIRGLAPRLTGTSDQPGAASGPPTKPPTPPTADRPRAADSAAPPARPGEHCVDCGRYLAPTNPFTPRCYLCAKAAGDAR